MSVDEVVQASRRELLDVLGMVSPVRQVFSPEKIAESEVGLPGDGNHHVIAGGCGDPFESQVGLVQVFEHFDAKSQIGNRTFRLTLQDVTLVEFEARVRRPGHANRLAAGVDSDVTNVGQDAADLAGDHAFSASEVDDGAWTDLDDPGTQMIQKPANHLAHQRILRLVLLVVARSHRPLPTRGPIHLDRFGPNATGKRTEGAMRGGYDPLGKEAGRR